MTTEILISKLDAALEYLERGWSVIPCHSPDMMLDSLPVHVRARIDPASKEYRERDVGKIPMLNEWKPYTVKRPTDKEIRHWWGQWPLANLAMVCGPVSDVFAMDADGERGVRLLAERGVWLGITLTSQTGRTANAAGAPDSGYHFLFKHPGDKIKTNVRVAPDLDIKSDGGYVVVPPSLHASGRNYEWLNPDTPLALAPEWLLEFIRKQNAPTGSRLTDDEIERVLKGSQRGQQHNDYLKIAAHWIGMGVPRKEVEQMTRAWAVVCVPPGDPQHLLKELDWVWEAEQQKRRSAEDMKVSRVGDDFRFEWSGLGIQIDLRSLHPERGGTQGTIDVTSSTAGDLHFGRIVLESTSARVELVRKLKDIRSDINWTAFLERVCKHASTEFAKGEEFRWLRPSPAPAARDFIERFIPAKESAILFADGGSAKSTVALGLAIANALGVPTIKDNPFGPNLRPCQKGLSLFLDWESTHEEHEDRLAALAKQHFNVPFDAVQDKIGYLRMRGAIWDQIPMLRARLSEMVGGRTEELERLLVIVDSYGPAAGPDPVSEDAANRTLSALHALGPTTRLMVSHVTKAGADNPSGAMKPLGSVYVYDRARSVWEMRKQGEPLQDGLLVRFDHRKANRGKIRTPFELRVTYAEDEFERTIGIGLRGSPLTALTLFEKIVAVLREHDGGPMTTEEIADAVGDKVDSIRTFFSRQFSRGTRRFRKEHDTDDKRKTVYYLVEDEQIPPPSEPPAAEL